MIHDLHQGEEVVITENSQPVVRLTVGDPEGLFPKINRRTLQRDLKKLQESGAGSTSAKWRCGHCALILVFAIVGCDRRPASVWEGPWQCWRAAIGTYFCEDLEQTWSDWKRKNDHTPAVAYACVSQEFDLREGDPWDYLCKPSFSPGLLNMDDDTAPRFHCFGTYDSETDYVDLHCEPYWELKPEEKQHGGSGWFLWLALQTPSGEEHDLLMATANQIAEREARELQAELAKTPVKQKGPSPERLQDALRQVEVEGERTKTPRSSAEIHRRVEEERKAWGQTR